MFLYILSRLRAKREKIKVVKTLTPEELLGLTDIEGSALSRNLGAEVYIPSPCERLSSLYTFPM